MARLREQNKRVYLITGGFDCLIAPVAEELGIPLENMFANKLYFHFSGKINHPIRLCSAANSKVQLSLPLFPCFVCARNATGEYAGFDVNQPTSRTGGKGEAITQIRRSLAQNVIITMIGDGATDLEASPPADNFIGYGGNIVRDEVRNHAQYYVADFETLYTNL